MSGINPLIDTLLHQVLGKKGEVPRQSAFDPVRPVDPGEGPRAVHSDSRLDPRAHPKFQLPATKVQNAQNATAYLRMGGTQAAPESTQTQLSNTGRAIASLLGKLPGPPSVIRSSIPLIPLQSQVTPPQQVAQQLQLSIQNSGLFYESKLAQFIRNEIPREQLLQQPQMQNEFWRQAEYRPMIAEPLQPIVKQQLEVLTNPVIRWEGDVWAGIFMALVIQLPEAFRRFGHHSGESQEDTPEDQQAFRTEVALSTPNLGHVKADILINKKSLIMQVYGNDESLGKMVAHQADLTNRMSRIGFDDVEVSLHAIEAEHE